MSVLKLRNHIPISGPARREPADGTESALRVSLGFEPAWYHGRCGVDFSERWHADPLYRHETLARMKAELHQAFPIVTYWDVTRQEDTWTISGVHGSYFIPVVFGCELVYEPDRWPAVVKRSPLSLEELTTLDKEKLLAAPIIDDLFRQMDIIEAQAGKIHGYLSWQGILNNAFNIHGQNIFVGMADQPERVRRFFALICDVMITLVQQVQARQRRSGFDINQLDVSNCVMNMISPRAYREFVFPHDKRIAESFQRFGVHTCNWNVTPYIKELAQLPRVGYLDMGMSSDMKQVREMFPQARRAVMYSPIKLQDAPIEEIENDLRRIYHELAPCDVVMADIQATTPDSRVHELLAICNKLELTADC